MGEIVRLYEETGEDKYRISFVHEILERAVDRMGLRAKYERAGREMNKLNARRQVPVQGQREVAAAPATLRSRLRFSPADKVVDLYSRTSSRKLDSGRSYGRRTSASSP